MEPQFVLTLFDFYWFEHGVFKDIPQPVSSPITEPKPILENLQILHRSLSDQILSDKDSFSSDSFSPNSVLMTPSLEAILSWKEIEDFPENFENPIGKLGSRGGKRGNRGKGINSRSLSDLEFEEVKGFMDLGFVFSEEDRNSSLVQIIPGLQRLGKENGNVVVNDDDDGEEEEEEAIDELEISRPYLSEAWGIFYEKKVEKPLMNWKIPQLGGGIGNENEMVIKDHLRIWAQNVASTVR